MVHVQAAHMINIYELGHDSTNNNHINSNNNSESNNNNNAFNKHDNIVSHIDTSHNKISVDVIDKLDNINMTDCSEDNRMVIVTANNVSFPQR